MPLVRAGVAVTACVGMVLAAAGCGSPDSKAAPPTQTQLAMIVPDYTSDYWDTFQSAAVAEGNDAGVTVISDAADTLTDASAQTGHVTAMAQNPYDCFAIAPVDPVKLVAPLAAVAKQKTPILNIGARLDEGTAQRENVPITSFIGPQDEEIGHLAARKMLTLVPSGSLVAMLVGVAVDPDASGQRTGFEEAVGGKLDVVTSKPTNDDYAKAGQVVSDLLDGMPNLRGIFTSSDTVGLAAAKAIKAAGMSSKVSVISVDGSQQGLEAVRAGTMAATVARFPALTGQVLVRACALLATKGTLKPRVTVPTRLVDSSNVSAAIASYPLPWERLPDPLTQ